MRPSWDETWMKVARVVAERSTCPRRHVGAVLVDKYNHVIAVAYNGAPAGQPHCDEAGCIIDTATGSCLRAVHSELNIVAQAGQSARGCTLYITTAPCWRCATLLVQVGIEKVVYAEQGPHSDISGYLEQAGVTVRRFE